MCSATTSAVGLHRAGIGSDAAAQKTTAELDGDIGFIKQGKQFIQTPPIAQTTVLMAMNGQEPGYKGISSFIVEKGTKDFQVAR